MAKAALPHIGSVLSGPSGPDTIELVEYIGGGAFGFVFKGVDRASTMEWAIKIPQVGVFGGGPELDAFQNEMLAASQLRHANIVAIHHVDPETPHLVLELVGGGTLKSHLDSTRAANKQLPIELLRVWLMQLVDGMEAINALFLHRDIKPDNILIAHDGTLKISDFGLSKLVGAATRSRTFKGGQHVLYMAPEGWQQQTNTLQTDMYAVGITMFEMCTLAFPYDVSSHADFEEMHLFSNPKLARSFRAELSPTLEQVLVRMMMKRATDRFATWAEVRRALNTAFSGGTRLPNTSSSVAAILQAATAAHQQEQEHALAASRKHDAEDNRRGIHRYQRDALLNLFRPLVEEFNEHSQIGKASVSENGNVVSFAFPHMRITVNFHDFGAPIPLAKHDPREIHFFATIENENLQGFNAALVHRGAADLYGQWEGWEIGVSALVRENVVGRRHGERFGFDALKFVDEFKYSNGTTHVYTYSRVNDMVARFTELAREPKGRPH
jgi:eukaryotic-like serine/threonine-protein kinase